MYEGKKDRVLRNKTPGPGVSVLLDHFYTGHCHAIGEGGI